MSSNHENSFVLIHRLAARVVPDVLRGAFKKHRGFRAVLPFVGTTATVYIALEAWSFWEDKFLCLVEQGEVRAEKVIEAPGGYSELKLYLRPGAMVYSYIPPGMLYMLELPQPAGEPVCLYHHINMASHMAAKLARGAGLRLQSVRQLLMQQAVNLPLLRLGLVECPEKRTSPTSGRVINLTAQAGALPAAESAGTAWSLLALPARAATWGAKHAAQAAVVAAGGLGDAAAMSTVAAQETVRLSSKPVEAIIGQKVTQAADFDGFPLPACPAPVGAFRAGVRTAYQAAGILSAIPEGLIRGALRLCSW